MFRVFALILGLALVSCTTHDPRPAPAPSTLPDFPLEVYLTAATGSVYQVDGNASYADILVRRGGKLARFGHDHVISARNIYGYLMIADDHPRGSRADLRLELKALIVDDLLTRKRFGLDTEPSQNDIEGTSENMHGKVLESDKWPQTHLQIVITGGAMGALQGQLTITLHGQELKLPVVIHIDEFTPDRLTASGSFSLMQSAFGIKPFNVMGGGLYVEDTVEVSYRLMARRYLPPAEKQN
jgi:hypothetical protein